MEPTPAFPKWFWISIGVIILATIIAVIYCNRKAKQVVSTLPVNSTDNSATVIDEVDSLNNILS